VAQAAASESGADDQIDLALVLISCETVAIQPEALPAVEEVDVVYQLF